MKANNRRIGLRCFLWRVLSVFIVSTAILSVGPGCSGSNSAKLIGQPAPATRVQLLDGDPAPLSQFMGNGKPLVLVFWASTCMYSPRTIESLDKLAVKLQPRGVQFLAVSIDKNKAESEVRDLIKYRDMGHFVHAFSGNDVHDEAYISFQGDELPYVLVIDGAGKIVAAGHRASVVEEYFFPS